MVSEFRKKKLLRVYKVFFDADGCGHYVDKEHFDLAVEKICKMRGWGAGHAKRKEFEEFMKNIWLDLQKQGDEDGDGKLTPTEWVAMWDEYAKNPRGAPEWQNVFCKLTFWLQDDAGDGEVDAEEFSSTYALYGIDKQKSLVAFNKMAQGRKGLKFDEFQEFFNEYFVTENPEAPGNCIFGSLEF